MVSSPFDRVTDDVLQKFEDEYKITLVERNVTDHLITRIIFYIEAIKYINENPLKIETAQTIVVNKLVNRLQSCKQLFGSIIKASIKS